MNEQTNEWVTTEFRIIGAYRLPHWIVIGYAGLSNVSPQTERRPLGNVDGDRSSKGMGNWKLTQLPF